jgi:hypothetical protein
MKRQFFVFGVLMTSILLLDSCSKEDDAGIQIDGNGKPGSAVQANISNHTELSGKPAGTGINSTGYSSGKDTAMSDYGIAIDPDGRARR